MFLSYDAKNNKVVKVRKFEDTQSRVKQDTMIYIHGNNKLPLTEYQYGTVIDQNGNEQRVRNVFNYIYGPDFGSIGVRVYQLDANLNEDPFDNINE